MNVTNQHNFPSSIVRAVTSNYKYQEKRYSVTSLLQSDRELILKRRYNDIIEQDVSTMIWTLLGSNTHYILEQIDLEDSEKVEYKMEHTFDNGYTLSGILDYLNEKEKLIIDYKVVKVYSYIYDKYNDKYLKQLQMCSWLYYKETGIWINHGQIVMIFKDWNKRETYKSDYPKYPVGVVDFDLGTPEEIEKWLNNRFERIIELEKMSDMELPMCTLEERFNNGDKYAVKKKANKTATKIHNTLEEAEEHLKNLENKYPDIYEIEIRKGEDNKCLNYCSCCHQCPHYLMNYDEDIKDIHKELIKEVE